MQIFLKRIIATLLLISCLLAATPAQPVINIEAAKMPLPAALLLLANLQHLNVILSPAIKGWVILRFSQTSPQKIFNFLLHTNYLSAEKIGNTYYISPTAALIKAHHETASWHEMLAANSPLVTAVWHLRYVSVNEVAHHLRQLPRQWLSAQGQLQVNIRTNTLLVKEHKSNLPNIAQLIKELDVPVQQILIEARLASIDVDYEHMLGINFTSNRQRDFTPETGHVSLAQVINNKLLDFKLSALENSGHGKLISKPSLFTANQQAASIESGEDIPYQQTTSAGATTVVFKKAVLSLRVTPQILPNNKILLKLQISQDRPSSLNVLGLPAITTRRIVTSVVLPNAHTVVLGGIYETSNQHSTHSIPMLGKIPIVSWLFNVHQQRKTKRELLIFVTPKIIT